MNDLWKNHINKYILVNKYNILKDENKLLISKQDYILQAYLRKIIMNDFNTSGYIQFLRSIRDFLIPLPISSDIRKNLLDFILEVNYEINKLCKSGEIEQGDYRIYIHSGFRSFIYQKKMYDKALECDKNKIAQPGTSEHQTGLAIDFGLRNKSSDCDLRDSKYNKIVNLLEEIGAKFGFILRYPSGKTIFTGYPEEKWHFRYVGSIASEIKNNYLSYEEYIIATFIIDNNLTLEEFLEKDYLEQCIGIENAIVVRNNLSLLDNIKKFLNVKKKIL